MIVVEEALVVVIVVEEVLVVIEAVGEALAIVIEAVVEEALAIVNVVEEDLVVIVEGAFVAIVNTTMQQQHLPLLRAVDSPLPNERPLCRLRRRRRQRLRTKNRRQKLPNPTRSAMPRRSIRSLGWMKS